MHVLWLSVDFSMQPLLGLSQTVRPSRVGGLAVVARDQTLGILSLSPICFCPNIANKGFKISLVFFILYASTFMRCPSYF